MWINQSSSLFVCNQSSISIRFNCPNCNTLNSFDDITVPEFSDNYENLTDTDETEDDERDCSNCNHSLIISITNGPGGCLIQVPNVADSAIEYEL